MVFVMISPTAIIATSIEPMPSDFGNYGFILNTFFAGVFFGGVGRIEILYTNDYTVFWGTHFEFRLASEFIVETETGEIFSLRGDGSEGWGPFSNLSDYIGLLVRYETNIANEIIWIRLPGFYTEYPSEYFNAFNRQNEPFVFDRARSQFVPPPPHLGIQGGEETFAVDENTIIFLAIRGIGNRYWYASFYSDVIRDINWIACHVIHAAQFFDLDPETGAARVVVIRSSFRGNFMPDDFFRFATPFNYNWAEYFSYDDMHVELILRTDIRSGFNHGRYKIFFAAYKNGRIVSFGEDEGWVFIMDITDLNPDYIRVFLWEANTMHPVYTTKIYNRDFTS